MFVNRGTNTVITGRAGAGKSTLLAQLHEEVLERNGRWYQKTGLLRPIYTNLKLSKELEDYWGVAESPDDKEAFIHYWHEPIQLKDLKDCDVFIDEIARFFDASQWQNTPLSLKAWLQQHRKLGINLYGNAQDFGQVDIAYRRLTSTLFYLVKIVSSRDPSPTRPPIKRVWGLSVVYTIEPTDYKEDQKENRTAFYSLFFITKRKTQIFDTRQIIKGGAYPPLQHIERTCENPDCGHIKVIHS